MLLVLTNSCFKVSSRPWGFEFLHACVTFPYNMPVYFGFVMDLDMGFETLGLTFCELKL